MPIRKQYVYPMYIPPNTYVLYPVTCLNARVSAFYDYCDTTALKNSCAHSYYGEDAVNKKDLTRSR